MIYCHSTNNKINKTIKKLIPSQDIFISTAAVSDFKLHFLPVLPKTGIYAD